MPISVIMPARNASLTISKSITSTLASLPKKSELLVIDDASEDGTFSELRRISDPRLHIFQNEAQLGVAGSLNLLLKEATHEVIARMDSDDVSLPWRFKSTLRRMESVDFHFSTHLAFRAKPTRIFPSAPIGLTHNQISVALLLENPLSHITMEARRSSIVSAGGYRSTLAEDYDLWLRAVDAFTFLKSPMPSVLYRIHDGQSTASRVAWRAKALTDVHLRESYKLHCTRIGIPEALWFDDWATGRPVPESSLQPLIELLQVSKRDWRPLARANIAARFERNFNRKIKL